MDIVEEGNDSFYGIPKERFAIFSPNIARNISFLERSDLFHGYHSSQNDCYSERYRIMTGYTVSDLHLFASRSKGKHVFDQLLSCVKEKEFLVLSGDIFDFKWSNFPSIEKAITEAIIWLTNLCRALPHSEIYYIMGNHDGIDPFHRALDKLATTQPNFQWHPTYFQFGSTLFLHGDIPIRSEGKLLSERKLVEDEQIKGAVMDILYHAITYTRILKLWRKTTNQNRKIPYISDAIDAHKELFNEEITKVYFGHTHNAVDGFEYKHRKFYNCGTAIRSFQFSILEVNLEA